VCHQLGRDYGEESFSGFEFRHNLHSDGELRCHLLHERCSDNVDEWPSNVNRISNLVSHFFDLDSSACPVIVVAISLKHSNESLLAKHIVPMICDHFPGVPVIAIQSEALSSKPSSCFDSLPLLHCLSYSEQSIPSSCSTVLAKVLNSCASFRQKGALIPSVPQFFSGASLLSSPNRVQCISVPTSPIAAVGSAPFYVSTGSSLISSSSPSNHASTSSPQVEALPTNTGSPFTNDYKMLGLSLKWGAEGLTVQHIVADSLAGRSGCFQVGDAILNVDGVDVASSRSSRHQAISLLRQACHAPVQVCTRAGSGWQGNISRPIGSMTLFQLSSSSVSPPKQPIELPQSPAQETGVHDADANLLFTQAKQCHSSGDSVGAATHLLNAARRNHPPSCAMLASFYLNGCGGLPQNYQLAFSLARWSTLQKDPDGMGLLACCFLFGLGTNQDIALAYTLAVGCADASPHGQFGLGYMYHHGLGVEKDASQAGR
jgi:hypothetical protein